ncbi:MAG: WG repeat-containing protein [Crocinitomicaceae bacterium]|nr:WG repeat-containing protein [Crocinitomicaceae bacterium]
MKASFITLILLSILCAGCQTSEEDPNDVFPEINLENFMEGHDIDGDGIADLISFDFTQGAHCCYLLHLELSSDTLHYEFPFQMDGGYLFGPDDSYPQHFNITDYDADGIDEIYLEIQTYNGRPDSIAPSWEEDFGITSNYIVIDFTDTLTIINIPKCISIEQFFVSNSLSDSTSTLRIFNKQDSNLNDFYGAKNKNGEIVILPILDTLTPFSQGGAIATLNNQEILIDERGRIIYTFEENRLRDQHVPEEGVILFTYNFYDELHYMNTQGEVLNDIPYQDARSFTEGLGSVQVANGKWGYVDINNNWVIQPKFDMNHPFEDGRAFVLVNDNYMWIDTKGNVIPE